MGNNSHSSLSSRTRKKSDFEAEKRKMKLLIVTFIGLVANSYALPHGSSGGSGRDGLTNGNRPKQNLPAGCQIQYKPVYDIVENEKFETKCTTKFKKQCTKKYNTVCTPWTETICKTLYKKVCETKYIDNCIQRKGEPYEEDVCVIKDIAVCDQHWECSNPNIPLSDCNDKVWVDNKETCQYLKKSVCETVQRVNPPQRICEKEPREECNDVPYEKCNDVTRNECEKVPYQDCKKVPYQDCKQVHSKVPEQVSQKRPFRVCDGQADQEIADYDDDDDNDDFIIELWTGAVDTDTVDAEDKQIEEVTTN